MLRRRDCFCVEVELTVLIARPLPGETTKLTATVVNSRTGEQSVSPRNIVELCGVAGEYLDRLLLG